MSMFLSLIGVYRPTREFHSYEDVTITGEGLHIFTQNAWHSWSLSSECSLACHTYCDGESVYNGHLHLLLSVEQRVCLYMFLRLRSLVAEIRTPNLPLAGPTLCLSDTFSALVFPYLGNITHKFLIKWTSIVLQEFLHIIVIFCCAF